jgi:hypothetical protein
MGGPMLRTLLKPALLMSAVLMLPIFLIHAQTFDDQGLDHFLRDDAQCLPPCVLGIVPGETHFYQSLLDLRAHDWVAETENNEHVLIGEPQKISWRWNGQQPAFLNPTRGGTVYSHNGVDIDEVMVDVGLPLGDLWLALGPPDEYVLSTINGNNLFPGPFLAFSSFYEDPQITVMGVLSCPYHETLWDATIGIRVESKPGPPDWSPGSSETLPQRVAQLEQRDCQGQKG